MVEIVNTAMLAVQTKFLYFDATFSTFFIVIHHQITEKSPKIYCQHTASLTFVYLTKMKGEGL